MILRNYYSLLSYGMFSSAPKIATTNGLDASVSGSGMNIPGAIGTLMTGYGGAGVVMGTGDTKETFGDYKLAGNVISGFVYSKSTSSGKDDNGPWVKAKFTITNNNTSDVTIREVGLMLTYASSSYCMVERTVLSVPIKIEGNGGVGQLEYTVRYNLPQVEIEAPDWTGSYGVEWDYSKSSSKLTRFGAAADFTDPIPAEAVDAAGSSPFDTVAPWSEMKRYNIIDGAVSYSEGEEGFSMTSYDTMVYIPEFWYAVWKDPYAMKMRWAISPTEKAGFQKHPGSGRYISRYHTANSGGYCSKSGLSPLASVSRTNFRSNSHAKGEKWWMIDYLTWSALQMLYLVEFADFNSQSVLGTGNNSGSKKNNGLTDACVYHTLKRSSNSNQYRWVENPYSNLYTWADGINSSYGHIHLRTENADYNDAIEDATYSGCYMSDGYITRFSLCDKHPWAFISASFGGSASTYVTDSCSVNTSGL